MGVDTTVRLPVDVNARDVADVAAALLGGKMCKKDLPHGSFYAHVEGAKLECSCVPECPRIVMPAGLKGVSNFLIHYETEDGLRLVLLRAVAINIALARGLVEFFGGSVDYSDSDSVDVNFRCRKPRRRNNPGGGKAWEDFQNAKLAVKPITREEEQRCRAWSAYPEYVTWEGAQ